jgi:predicted deacylase
MDNTTPERKKIQINNILVEPGRNVAINLPVGKLPVGHRIYIKINIYHALEPGPVILFLGGLHGDEINGVEILKQAIHSGTFNQIKKGAVIAISLLNIYGFINFSRDVPDGKDVNRSFPGSTKGSLASRIAGILSKKILPMIDYGVDFHTGGANRYNYPQIRFNKKDPHSRKLATTFNAPVMFEQNTIAKSLRKVAKTMGVPILVFEGGEALRLDDYTTEVGMQGIKNILYNEGMLEGIPTERPILEFANTSWIRSNGAGIFTSFVKSGQHVQKGIPIGSVSDPYGDQMEIVAASRDGFIVGHNNIAVVNQGDALFHIAFDQNQ